MNENPLLQLRLPVWEDRCLAAILGLIYVFCLVLHNDLVGIPRDESMYLSAADNAANWWWGVPNSKVKSLSKAEIEKGFKYNHEHPVLMKTLFGVSHRAIHGTSAHPGQGFWAEHLSHITAYRLPTMLLAGLSIYLTFLLGCMLKGRIAGLAAALSLATMPHVFFHSSLACFDAPVTCMWLLICYCFIRATRSRAWAVASGLALGLGFSTKLNIFFVPFALLMLAIFECWRFKRRTGAWKAQEGHGPIFYYMWIGLCMLLLGAAVFFAHWPWLWRDMWEHLSFYVRFHARHVHYPVDFLGKLYYKPPFPVYFPFVFSLFTVPVATISAGAVGLWVTLKAVKRDFCKPESRLEIAPWVVLLNAFVPFLIIAMPHTPIFGGTKHWMPAMPFCAVLAGVGVARCCEMLIAKMASHKRIYALLAAVFALLLFAPAAYETAHYGAHGAAYFNALAGGAPGAAKLRMPRNFWGYSTIAELPLLNRMVQPGELVFWHKATRGSIDAYKRDHLLRGDITYTGDWTEAYSQWAVYHDQREKWPEELDIWRSYGTDWPVAGYFLDGVQLMGIYHRP